VEILGAPIVPTCNTSLVPAGQGGQVESGRYVLQSIEIYPTGDCPPAAALTGQVTWLVCGEEWATVNQFPGVDGGPDIRQFDVTASTDASALAFSVACPAPVNPPEIVNYQYTATPGHFSLIYPSSYYGSGLAFSFTEEDDFVLQ
jgi:hypothetical protein